MMDCKKCNETKGSSIYREPRTVEDWDAIGAQFIHMTASDIEVDWLFCSLGQLFAEAPPKTFGGYAHHPGYR